MERRGSWMALKGVGRRWRWVFLVFVGIWKSVFLVYRGV
jgi:hypothetical protein